MPKKSGKGQIVPRTQISGQPSPIQFNPPIWQRPAIKIAAWVSCPTCITFLLGLFFQVRGYVNLGASQIILVLIAATALFPTWVFCLNLHKFRKVYGMVLSIIIVSLTIALDRVTSKKPDVPAPVTASTPKINGPDLVSQMVPYIVTPTEGFDRISPSHPIRFNIIYRCTGPQICNHVFSFELLQLVPNSIPNGEAILKRNFVQQVASLIKQAMDKNLDLGTDIAVGSSWLKTTNEQAMSVDDVRLFRARGARLYFLNLIAWKDPHNAIGTSQECRWLQDPPKNNKLEENNIMWQDCGYIVDRQP